MPRPRLTVQPNHFTDDVLLDLGLGVDGICGKIAPGELRLLVSHHGRRQRRVLRLHPPCDDLPAFSEDLGFGWERRGQVIPGLRYGGHGAGLVVRGAGRRHWTRVYRVNVFWNNRRKLRRWLRARHTYKPLRRIHEGSIEFRRGLLGKFGDRPTD